jgi:hypothetical protein
MLGRRLLLAAFVPYVLWLIFGYRYHLVDGVNLGAHEAGHMLFRFFGQTLHVLGGSIGQLAFPVAFVVHFARRRQWFETAVLTVWVAESLMYMAEYLGDARVQVLPLVGGHIHDWHWMLSRADLLEHCETIAGLLHGFASLLAVAAIAFAAYTVRPGVAVTEDDRAEIDI